MSGFSALLILHMASGVFAAASASMALRRAWNAAFWLALAAIWVKP